MGSRCRVEIACFNVASALTAARSGADRIEFCRNAGLGGTTPLYDDYVQVRKATSIPIYIMVRPRGGDFVYSKEELAEMKKDIIRFKDVADGFVFGVLSPQGEINERDNSILVNLAYPLPCTIHRAFDETNDLSESLMKVIECGFQTILTSGGASDALTGAEQLAELVQQSSDKISVMPGGNVRASNVQELRRKTHAEWFHSSARTDVCADSANAAEICAISSLLGSDTKS